MGEPAPRRDEKVLKEKLSLPSLPSPGQAAAGPGRSHSGERAHGVRAEGLGGCGVGRAPGRTPKRGQRGPGLGVRSTGGLRGAGMPRDGWKRGRARSWMEAPRRDGETPNDSEGAGKPGTANGEVLGGWGAFPPRSASIPTSPLGAGPPSLRPPARHGPDPTGFCLKSEGLRTPPSRAPAKSRRQEAGNSQIRNPGIPAGCTGRRWEDAGRGDPVPKTPPGTGGAAGRGRPGGLGGSPARGALRDGGLGDMGNPSAPSVWG